MRKTYSISWLAEQFGRDRRTVTQALRTVPPDGKISGKPAWSIQSAFNSLVGAESDAARLKSFKARKAELEVGRLEGKLIDLEEHRAICDAAIGVVLTGLGGLPARISDDPKERRRVDGFVDEIRLKMSSAFRKLANEEEK